jgi:hypothetical protein
MSDVHVSLVRGVLVMTRSRMCLVLPCEGIKISGHEQRCVRLELKVISQNVQANILFGHSFFIRRQRLTGSLAAHFHVVDVSIF